MTGSRRLPDFGIIMAVAGMIAASSMAPAQTPPIGQAQPSQPGQVFTIDRNGKIYRIGDACVRKSDSKTGVVKRDACARWYCSLPEAKDIIELRPNLAAELGCVWRLYGTHCRCGPRDEPKKP